MHLLLITKLHDNTIDLLYKIQKNFIWQGKKAKKGVIKNIDLRNKITMQCPWVKRLSGDD